MLQCNKPMELATLQQRRDMTDTASTYRSEFWLGLTGLAVGLFIGLAIAATQGSEISQLPSAVSEVWLEQPERLPHGFAEH